MIRDVVAGLTIGLMLLPQALAYAELAGLDAYVGLYASWFGILFYIIFGTSKKCAIGPTAISSALMFDFIQRPANWPDDLSCHGARQQRFDKLISHHVHAVNLWLGDVVGNRTSFELFD